MITASLSRLPIALRSALTKLFRVEWLIGTCASYT